DLSAHQDSAPTAETPEQTNEQAPTAQAAEPAATSAVAVPPVAASASPQLTGGEVPAQAASTESGQAPSTLLTSSGQASSGQAHVQTGISPAGLAGGRGGWPAGLDNRGVPMAEYPLESRRRGEQGT